MHITFDSRVILLFFTLFQGLAGLRLIKVSIPAYKLRGESAFLECQYELTRPNYAGNSQSSSNNNNKHSHNQHGGGGADLNYIDTDSAGADEMPVIRRRTRTYPYSQHQQQHHQQQQEQTQQQPQYHQKQQEQQHHYNAGGGGYYQSQYQQQQYPEVSSAYEGHQRTNVDVNSRRNFDDSWGHNTGSYGGGGGGGGSRRVSASTYGGRGTGTGMLEHQHEDTDDVSMGGFEDSEESNDGSEALYAVKWYKDNEEFYRFVPKANPPKQSYRVDGIRVIEEHSDSSRVLLRGLTLNSTGSYRCEVSAEAPNFSSVQGEGRMDIVYLPRDGPHIKGQQFQYQIGEILNLNCTSGKSHPASHLQWFINEQPVMDPRFLINYNDTVHKHGLITSTLGLELTVDARHFHNGAMKVKCLASISPVLWKGGKESVLQRRPGIIDNREAMLLVRSSSMNLHQNLSLTKFLLNFYALCILSQLLLRIKLS